MGWFPMILFCWDSCPCIIFSHTGSNGSRTLVKASHHVIRTLKKPSRKDHIKRNWGFQATARLHMATAPANVRLQPHKWLHVKTTQPSFSQTLTRELMGDNKCLLLFYDTKSSQVKPSLFASPIPHDGKLMWCWCCGSHLVTMRWGWGSREETLSRMTENMVRHGQNLGPFFFLSLTHLYCQAPGRHLAFYPWKWREWLSSWWLSDSQIQPFTELGLVVFPVYDILFESGSLMASLSHSTLLRCLLYKQ